ncbi:MAG: DUF308 domain-containing protein [Faecousia sp.]
MIQKIKANAGSILICLLEILVGVLLLIDPIGFSSGIIIAVGVVLMLFGCVRVVHYFHETPEAAAGDMTLAQGLLCITAGLFCVLRSDWFIVTFPVLTILYGIAVLVTGLYKVQMTVDMLRLKKGRWGWMAVSAVLSLALAALILWNPFTSAALLWDFTAISLIVEAVFDIATIILSLGKRKDQQGCAQGQ